jgi:hypothetical protein
MSSHLIVLIGSPDVKWNVDTVLLWRMWWMALAMGIVHREMPGETLSSSVRLQSNTLWSVYLTAICEAIHAFVWPFEQSSPSPSYSTRQTSYTPDILHASRHFEPSRYMAIVRRIVDPLVTPCCKIVCVKKDGILQRERGSLYMALKRRECAILGSKPYDTNCDKSKLWQEQTITWTKSNMSKL